MISSTFYADFSLCLTFLYWKITVLIIPGAERSCADHTLCWTFLCWTFRAERSVLKIPVLKIPDPPARGPEQAGGFILLGPYQSVTTFPTVKHCHFCLNWYKVYEWIEFSEMTKKAYCFICRFAYPPGQCDDAFTKNGFNSWEMAINKFRKHEGSLLHKKANESYVNIVKNYKDNMDVLKLMNIEHNKTTSGNRNYLKEIIRTIIFLSKQGLSFWGHRENDDFENRGNCIARQIFHNKIFKKIESYSFALF